MVICDFCSAVPVVAAYPCCDFVIPETPAGSRGAWAACVECADLIDRGQREALAYRAACLADRNLLSGGPALLSLPETEVLPLMRALHQLFFTHRNGDPVPVDIN